MTPFSLHISSPDGDLYAGEAARLIVRGTEGDLAVMAGHAPFVTAIRKGRVTLEEASGARKIGIIEAGLLTVDREKTTVLTSAVKWTEET